VDIAGTLPYAPFHFVGSPCHILLIRR
jgi:hypothetical protein